VSDSTNPVRRSITTHRGCHKVPHPGRFGRPGSATLGEANPRSSLDIQGAVARCETGVAPARSDLSHLILETVEEMTGRTLPNGRGTPLRGATVRRTAAPAGRRSSGATRQRVHGPPSPSGPRLTRRGHRCRRAGFHRLPGPDRRAHAAARTPGPDESDEGRGVIPRRPLVRGPGVGEVVVAEAELTPEPPEEGVREKATTAGRARFQSKASLRSTCEHSCARSYRSAPVSPPVRRPTRRGTRPTPRRNTRPGRMSRPGLSNVALETESKRRALGSRPASGRAARPHPPPVGRGVGPGAQARPGIGGAASRRAETSRGTSGWRRRSGRSRSVPMRVDISIAGVTGSLEGASPWRVDLPMT